MKQLDITQRVAGVFGQRTLRAHVGQRSVERFVGETSTTWLILDLATSRSMLHSAAFESLNYFTDGYRRAAQSSYDVTTIENFFSRSPLFLEGSAHQTARREFESLLGEQIKTLKAAGPAIHATMLKHRRRLTTALDFSRFFVERCLTALIRTLLSCSEKTALRALRTRRNVFYYHYHPLRHRDMNTALATLVGHPSAARLPPPGQLQALMAQSLLVMGYDPLIATLCANLVDGTGGSFGASTRQYCPVSYVSRRCVEATNINGAQFECGDVCYVALVPSEQGDSSGAMPFGAGLHNCVGKVLSLNILQLAEQIVTRDFADGFATTPAHFGDGAFLCFKNN